MPSILNHPFFKPKSNREYRIATPREFVTSWLSWVAVLGLLYLAAFKLGVLPSVLRVQANQAAPLQAR